MSNKETGHYKYHINEDINEYYTIGKQLGKGAFSVVKLGTCLETGQEVAVKIMEKPGKGDTKKQNIIDTEISILKRVDHPNVVKMYEAFETDEHIMLVLQLITGGELFEKIVELNCYTEKDASRVVKQILQGLKALHEHGVVHRDLKPENLLLSDKSMDANVLITDFGLSAILPEDGQLHDAVGTPSYISPEILITLDSDEGYGTEVDVWGVGVITYILLSGFPPFYGDDEDEIYDKIEAGEYDFPSPYWDPISEIAKDFIQQALQVDKRNRITIKGALEHPWISAVEETQAVPLDKTKEQIAKFNARRKFKSAIKGLIAVNKLASGLTSVKRTTKKE